MKSDEPASVLPVIERDAPELSVHQAVTPTVDAFGVRIADESGAVGSAPRMDASEDDDDYYDYDDEYDCTHCGGEGFREVDDPLWDDCDEFGYGPCGSCNGTGLRSRQWVF